jgi:MFS transporter, DHA1 family, inner membrane transport protein
LIKASMSEDSQSNRRFKGRLVLVALLVGMFLTVTVTVFVSVFLVDIAKTFGVTIGTVSLFGLISQFVALFMGIALSALALRFKHKSLYLFGAAMYGAGVLLYFFAPDLVTLLLAIFFLGIGGATITIMVYSLIGELFPLEKRGWAIGLTLVATQVAYFFLPLLSGVIGQIAGWRSVLLLFIFPTSIVCLVLGLLFIPSKSPHEQAQKKSMYLNAFKEVFLKKSAVACLVSRSLLVLIVVVPVFSVSFYRMVFSISAGQAGVFYSIAAAGALFGAAAGGRLVNRLGRKPIAVVASVVSGIAAILFTFMPDVGVSVALWVMSASFGAIAWVGLAGLTLEQAPSFRASMMSVNETFQALGIILGTIIGGSVLNILQPQASNFQLLMTILGAGGIASGVIILLFAKDLCIQ